MNTIFDYNATAQNTCFITDENDKEKIRKIRDEFNKTNGSFHSIKVITKWSIYGYAFQKGIVLGYESNVGYLTIFSPINEGNTFIKIRVGNMSYIVKK